MNKVIAGDYKGKGILCPLGGVPQITLPMFKKIKIIKENVESYEVQNTDSKKSASSAIGRAAIGAALLGPVGIVAGVSAKNKNSYQIAISFTDGKRSLIEVDQRIYKEIMKQLF